MTEPRPLYWSLRRELWENRSVYLAPLIVAAIVLFASLIGTIGQAKRVRNAAGDPVKQRTAMVSHLEMAPAPIMLTTFIVAFFYCLDALYGERRDRSILFWKSLPVSDRTTVLSKAAIPLVVLPAIALVLGIAAQVILLFPTTLAVMAAGVPPARFFHELAFFEGLVIMVYGLTAHVLWFAPIYGWLLLVSAWAKRAPILWAVLPPLAISAVERAAFGTMSFLYMLQYRMGGAMKEAFTFRKGAFGHVDTLSQLELGRFLSRPGLWVGLLFAALCLVLAVRLRRNREPI